MLNILLAGVFGSVAVVEPWGRDSFRVRVAPTGLQPRDDLYTALLDAPTPNASESPANTNGNLRWEMSGTTGARQFVRVSDGKVLLTEEKTAFFPPMSAFHREPQFTSTFSVGAKIELHVIYLTLLRLFAIPSFAFSASLTSRALCLRSIKVVLNGAHHKTLTIHTTDSCQHPCVCCACARDVRLDAGMVLG